MLNKELGNQRFDMDLVKFEEPRITSPFPENMALEGRWKPLGKGL